MQIPEKPFIYRMPAEWEPHSAVWLAWPHDKITFGSLNQRGNKLNSDRLAKVEKTFLKIIKTLKAGERVNLIIKAKKQDSHNPASRLMLWQRWKNVRIFETDYADVWTRDYMPTFVTGGSNRLTAIKWNYSAYGEKFPDLLKDNRVWSEVNAQLITTLKPDIVLEAGAIEVNGNGVLLATEQCLRKRNPHLTKGDYEKAFARYLGITKIIWLRRGLVNDHTDGHIDELARFVSPNKILCAYEDQKEDENYGILKQNYEDLSSAADFEGRQFEIIRLPMPHMRYGDGKKAPVSYANFYIGNTVVLVSLFKDPFDAKALEIIQDCFPEREVIGVDCTDIIYGGGAIHCLTQQQPAVY